MATQAWAKLLVGCLALVACASVLAELDDCDFAGVRVVDVIENYRSEGYQVFYSTGLVRESLRFRENPPAGEPIERFRRALQTLGLSLEETFGNRDLEETGDSSDSRSVYRIVRSQVSRAELKGRVVDATTGLPVSGVRVIVGGLSATTDESGWFQLAPQKDAAPLSVSRPGYESRVLTPDGDVEALLEISLIPVVEVDEILVVSSRYSVRDVNTASHLLDLDLLDSVPRLGEDPLRIANHLPGMASLGVSAKPHIRGGSQDELLVLFNNLELLEPFHLRDFHSVFSSFNPSLVQSIDVYTGGFPARYGDRMSGVMDIEPTDNHAQAGGEVSLSLLNTSVLLHGPVDEGRGDWALSARRGNLDILTKEINSTLGEPSYSDWFAQVRYELNPRTELDVGLFAYDDDIELSDFDTDGEIATSRYENVYGWAQIHRSWTSDLDGSSVLYYGDIRHDRVGMLFDEDLEEGQAFVDDARRFKLVSLGQHFRYSIADDLFAEFGARLSHQEGSYDYRANIERGELASIIGTELDTVRAFDLDPSGLSGGVYGALRGKPFERLTLEAGLRWDFQDYSERGFEDQVSPRLSVKYDVTENSQVRLSAGRFYQPQAIHELQVGDGIDLYSGAQYADHYIGGWYQTFGDTGLSLRTEVFQKDFHRPKRRFENLFNPLVLLPELASDRVEIAAREGRAKGIEATLRYQRDESLIGWLTYSDANAEDLLAGQWSPRVWDQGRTISAGFSWVVNRWSVGAAILWNDGWRTTALPATVPADEAVTLARNADRLRDYMTVDLQISRTWEWRTQSLTVFAELTNVLNRSNVGGIEYDIEENEDTGELWLTPQPETLLPLVPALGVRWVF